ncbi:hypothetical protein ES703_45234 [subsurface metagenome]
MIGDDKSNAGRNVQHINNIGYVQMVHHLPAELSAEVTVGICGLGTTFYSIKADFPRFVYQSVFAKSVSGICRCDRTILLNRLDQLFFML